MIERVAITGLVFGLALRCMATSTVLLDDPQGRYLEEIMTNTNYEYQYLRDLYRLLHGDTPHGSSLPDFQQWMDRLSQQLERIATNATPSVAVTEPFAAWTNFFEAFFPGMSANQIAADGFTWFETPGFYLTPWDDASRLLNFPAFASVTMGGLYDNTFLETWTFDTLFRPQSEESLANWYWWMVEAMRRQFAATTNNAATSAALSDALMRQNATNAPGWSETYTDDALDDAVQDYESAVAEPDTTDAPSQGDAPAIEAVVPDLDWELTASEPSEVRVFGFDQLDPSASGVLKIDFTAQPWPVIHGACRFAVAVLFVCGMLGIVRSEWNFWSTLGGSAT